MNLLGDWVSWYVLIGVLITSGLFLTKDVRDDAATMDGYDLAGFLVFMVLTWPTVLWHTIVE